MPRSASLIAAFLAVLTALAVPGRAERNLRRPPGTTRYAPMVAQLRSLLAYDKAQGEGRMQLSSIGRSVKGRDIWMVTLHEPATVTPTDTGDGMADEGLDNNGRGDPAPTSENSETTVGAQAPRPSESQATPPKRVFYLCRQHGHEPASTEGALSLVRDLVHAPPDSPLVEDLRRVTVCVVPMANPDGAEAFLRHNAHNVDLNRDWLRRTQPETQAWYRAIQRIKPDLLTDQHELYPDDSREDFTETAGVGCGASPELIAACGEVATTVQASMAAAGFPIVCHWITDHHPARLAHRYENIVAGVPTVLFETNRLSGSGRDVVARGRAQYQFMVTVLRDMAGERPALLAEAAARAAMDRTTLLASRHTPYQRPAGPPAPPPTVPPASGDGGPPKDNE